MLIVIIFIIVFFVKISIDHIKQIIRWIIRRVFSNGEYNIHNLIRRRKRFFKWSYWWMIGHRVGEIIFPAYTFF